jgi:hypothetical protein
VSHNRSAFGQGKIGATAREHAVVDQLVEAGGISQSRSSSSIGVAQPIVRFDV